VGEIPSTEREAGPLGGKNPCSRVWYPSRENPTAEFLKERREACIVILEGEISSQDNQIVLEVIRMSIQAYMRH